MEPRKPKPKPSPIVGGTFIEHRLLFIPADGTTADLTRPFLNSKKYTAAKNALAGRDYERKHSTFNGTIEAVEVTVITTQINERH